MQAKHCSHGDALMLLFTVFTLFLNKKWVKIKLDNTLKELIKNHKWLVKIDMHICSDDKAYE